MEEKSAVNVLTALGHATRLRIFKVLVRAAPEGLPAGAIASELELPDATLSFHLKEMKHAGIAGARRAGRQQIYTADFDTMNRVVAYLLENCCQGTANAKADVADCATCD